MAINNTINNGILTLITKGSFPNTISYSSGVYIGLLTTLPTDAADMSAANPNWREVPDSLPDNVDTGYSRYPLGKPSAYSTGAHGDLVISNTYPKWDSYEGACIIINDGDDIMFPNIFEKLDESIFWDVQGFALFSAATGGTMIAYGKLVNEDGGATSVRLKAGSVPIFYKNSFKLMLKDGDTSAANNETPAAGGNS